MYGYVEGGGRGSGAGGRGEGREGAIWREGGEEGTAGGSGKRDNEIPTE